MTEVFASTAAVTLPVLALAGVLQIRPPQQILMVLWFRMKWVNLIVNAGPVLAWAALMVWMSWAEWISLETLRGRETSDTAAAWVQHSMVAAMVFLVVLPALRAWAKTQALVTDDPHWWKKEPDKSAGDDGLPESGRQL
ncbi:hypothetical protein [Streptomyces canus]|uniref:hypothetical protein n=1 Tax=Streptomyces canus TaxID=58343 RepID=UPI002DDA434B|nr:hypothetical protein [Streptomyces canus]WSD91783.1 hypothetical protein OG925_49275 [Streptomyces canus]